MGLFFNKNSKRKLEEEAHEQKLREYAELQAKYNDLEQKYQNSQTEYTELNKTIEKLKSQENEIKKSIDTGFCCNHCGQCICGLLRQTYNIWK